jgi:uncharacterized membrane protein YedE/YeeE
MKPRLVILFVAGLMFGLGLAISGMTDPARIAGFLNVTGHWDPSLLIVMAGAVVTCGGGLAIWRKLHGDNGWFGTTLPTRDPDPIDWRLTLGATIFGVGWGLGGLCPGPAIANLGGLRMESLVFVPAMAAGMLLARAGFGADRQ